MQELTLNLKQTRAIDYLEDQVTNEVLFGGGAGGGKSILGCFWLMQMCFQYPGTRWLMGRSELKTLKETTLNSFFEVARLLELTAMTHYRYNEQKGLISFPNGSVIMLKDLFAYPADPNFDSLGSLEISGAFIDECNQITEKAKNVVKSRIRYRLDENGIIPKVLMTCNPAKNWTYHQFYKKWKDGDLEPSKQFIQALVTDNPDISRHYRDNLIGLDEISKQRLLYGNWEYDDDKATLIEYERIIDCFSNTFVETGDDFITVDVARFGNDKTVIAHWKGWRVKLYQYKGLDVTETAGKVKALMAINSIPVSKVIADEDGVGGGVVDILKCKGFVNNSSPLPNPLKPKDEHGKVKPENYVNLKSQCYYRLAERINNKGLYIELADIEMKADIIQELEQVKQHNMDKDGKKSVMPKDKVKELIGRSPDYSDTLMMREYFELKPTRQWTFA